MYSTKFKTYLYIVGIVVGIVVFAGGLHLYKLHIEDTIAVLCSIYMMIDGFAVFLVCAVRAMITSLNKIEDE